jgi:hypothetical protein
LYFYFDYSTPYVKKKNKFFFKNKKNNSIKKKWLYFDNDLRKSGVIESKASSNKSKYIDFSKYILNHFYN